MTVVLVRVSLRVRPAMGVNTASQKKTRQKGLQSNCFPMLSMRQLALIDISCEQSKMVEEKGRSYCSLLLTAFPAESSKMGLLEGTPIYLF